MGREFELKYRADAAQIAAIREKFGAFSSFSMETAYYDTFDLKLSMRRWTLRRRSENGKSVCTAKIPLPDGSRGEWEVESPSILSAIMELCKLGAPMELAALSAGGLIQTCGAKFTRLAATLKLSGCTVELALDQGVLLGGGREEALCEVEIELKSGDREALMAFGRDFARKYGLETEHKSKFARANALASEV